MKKFPITEAVLRWLESTLAERFSNVWRLSQNDSGLSLQLVGAEGLILFDSLCKGFSHASSDLPFTSWAAEQEGWKSVLGDPLPAPGIDVIPSPLIEEVNEDYVIHYDILGLMYWMLTRIEEVERNDLDEHGRFPAHSSHAFKYNYLDRPVVDEWLHILGQVIVRKWPSVTLKQHQFKMLISCDVDSPFALDGTISKMIRRAAGDILIRKAPNELYKTIVGTWYTRRGNRNMDPHRQGINFIMEVNERYDRKVAFYFISKISHPTLDNCFNLNSKSMRKILHDIHVRGHEIGIHPGYNSYLNSQIMLSSVKTLLDTLSMEGIYQSTLGGRQHYLRWKTPDTARLISSSGIDYDATLGYADHAGFRCGTCYEYNFFDVECNSALELRIRPLVEMEVSVFDSQYMNMSVDDGIVFSNSLKNKVAKVTGAYTLLWHNSELDVRKRKVYKSIVN